ncbi:probable 28S ribosomal protein S6, mitochondrial [Caerostris darwini]|uniref:Small ribosomal subunit protein bS6m n=1 Tax=Caerostris darwini TaxID=1538125 RepID=A0AAV4PJ27_9ARAC|nr:probable 28S ribosomal protein S6, mitochondrial [Caerostris darwini]
MPSLELSLIMKTLPKQELVAALKRVGTLLLEKGVVIEKLENIGTRELPVRIRKEGVYHYKGSYFVYTFMGQRAIHKDLDEMCKLDTDILKHGLVLPFSPPEKCTLEEELQPPALRKSVQNLLNESKKHKGISQPYYKHIKEYDYYDIYM